MSFTNDLKKIRDAIEQATKEAIDTPQMRKIAEKAALEIKKRTRLGTGVATPGGPQGKLAPLKNSTVENRKRLKIKGDLSGETSPGRSNLTATGQMLDSLRGKATGPGKAVVELTGTRKDGNTNEEIGEFHEKGTSRMPRRPFMNLTALQLDKIKDDLRKDILARVKKSLTKLR